MSKKVKRNKEKLIQKEYQEKLANFTPEEKQAKDDRDLAMRKKITQLLGTMAAKNMEGINYVQSYL
jgi:hypothetical protein